MSQKSHLFAANRGRQLPLQIVTVVEVGAEIVGGHQQSLLPDPRLDGVRFAVERQDVARFAQDVGALVGVGQETVPLGDQFVDALLDACRLGVPFLVDQEFRCVTERELFRSYLHVHSCVVKNWTMLNLSSSVSNSPRSFKCSKRSSLAITSASKAWCF